MPMNNILIVDDSTSMRQMVDHTLSSAGFNITAAEDGDVALDIAKRRMADHPGDAFDLVITDVNMPNMDGISLIRELRTLTDYQFKPILVLTTESGDDKKREGKQAGATGWIVKPFVPAKLVEVATLVLNR